MCANLPTKLHDALSNPEWVDAMNVEMEALKKNESWDLVPLPKGKKVVRCRWVFTLKHKADGSIDRYKVGLEGKGYIYTFEVDYLETFVPVAKLNTMHVLLSLAANRDWPLLQFDVKNEFLHGHLKEEIYMVLLSGISVTSKEGVVYDKAEMQNLQKYLALEFEMTSLGDLKYFLGIEVARSKHGIFMSQRKYVLDLLAKTGMLDCKPIDTPSEQNHKLGLYLDQVPTDKEHYQRLVGKLIYLAHTRLDIAYEVSKSNSWQGVKVSKYGYTDVERYMDANWAGSVIDKSSMSGYFTFVCGNIVTWRSKKQKIVSRSSAEAEYRGMTQGVYELLWFRRLLGYLGFEPKKPMDLYCNNKVAIVIAHNLVQHDRTKNVEVDRHFIKEKLDAEIISFLFISSKYQLSDALTKAVFTTVFLNSLDKLGMRTSLLQLKGECWRDPNSIKILFLSLLYKSCVIRGLFISLYNPTRVYTLVL
ncbi:hypothetical protein L3X38_041341 [Prunus dulcis]|uniref:Reverse transcriptase Ty1/copia-type domain-containing protein n=1 Tax=Prunus dulcis TaxID=3755 RepID=A0AAD4UT20_PRUDU|nr:hypothetical protein L3X38_041341 [Prunus dulcis]